MRNNNKRRIFHVHVMAVWLMLVALAVLPLNILANNIYVNNLTGSDSNSGLVVDKPFKTIRKAIAVVKPGDTVHLANTGSPYKESLALNDVNGTEDKRITIDGHGSTLSGCQPLNISEWVQVSPGLYKNSIFYGANRFVGDFLRIYFFLFDGKINRMGRSRKGPNAAFKKPEDLAENEWTFTENDSSFYLKINPAKQLKDCNIEQPVRSNAVAVTGNTSYVTVRNIICTHVYNDGFGLTGTAKKLRFENIQSHYCGDDGISAHAFVQFEVYNFVSIGNATGIADSGSTDTYYDGVVIKDIVGTDVMFLNERPGQAIHTVKNMLVLCNGANAVTMFTNKQPDGYLTVKLDNVLIVGNKNRDSPFKTDGETELYTTHCTFIGLNFLLNGKNAVVENTLVSGTNSFIAPANRWQSRNNIYKLDKFTVNNVNYSSATKSLQAYKAASGDKASVWINKAISSTPLTASGTTAGADISKMPLKNEIMKKYFLEVASLRK